MSDKLARVEWKMGQTLLPCHFLALEESLLADTVTRLRTRGLPAWGVASLKLNETLLAEGVVSIAAMSLVMPSGLLLDVPASAEISPFNLNVPGSTSVTVYCHLLKQVAAAEGSGASSGSGEEGVGRAVRRLVLTSEQGYAEALETMKLGQFEKGPEATWSLSGAFIPPLLQVGTSPYLRSDMDGLAEALELFRYKLSQDIAASFLSGDSLSTAKECLKSVYVAQRLLVDVKGQIHPHPYHLLEALSTLYAEVCFYRNQSPENVTAPYQHEQLAECFARVFGPLRAQMLLVQAKSPYLPFTLRDGAYRVELPKEMRQAKDLYFLVQKPHVNKQVSVRDMKLASSSRVSLMHKLALAGVAMRKIEQPPFQHPFGAEVDFYALAMGEEWDHALRELAMAFYVVPGLEGVKFFLYWRSG